MTKARIIIRGTFPDALAENLIIGLGAMEFHVAAKRRKKGGWKIAAIASEAERPPPLQPFELPERNQDNPSGERPIFDLDD